MEYFSRRCGNCGAELDGIDAIGGVIECKYCHSRFPVARSTDGNVLHFLFMGEHEMDVGEFDKAHEAYAKAAQFDEKESAAYWGMALSDFKVRFLHYVNDKDETKLQPICHEVSKKVFSEDENYKKAIACATAEQRVEYERVAHDIDYIRGEFYRFQKEGVDYDCFICVKVTDDATKRKTPDSDRANDLYYHLRDRGYKPFYSEREIQNKQGADYEARILYALYSSETMIIVCSDEKYLQTKWVKNEYTRFMGLIRNDEKEYDSITIAYFDTPIDKLPGRDGRLQGVNLNSPDAYSKIIDFVDAHYKASFAVPDIVRKSYGARTYDKNAAVRTGVQKRKLGSLGGSAEISVSDNSILKNATDFLRRGDYKNAVNFANILIKNNPANSAAYELLFLAENKCTDRTAYENMRSTASSFDNLEKAIAVASGDSAKELYGMLYRHIEKTLDVAAYSEYITLPDSTDEQIAALNKKMYADALRYGNQKIFDTIIQTVGDVDLFIKMNVEFARKLNDGTSFGVTVVAPYYRAVLEKADAGHGESLWYVFVAAHAPKNQGEYFCDQNNFPAIESGLFAYGYNEFAAEKLFSICESELKNKNDNAVALLNFLLSMIPSEKNGEYYKRLRSSVKIFMDRGSYANAKQYNDMYLAAKSKDDRAHLNACLINHKMNNPVSLFRLGDGLLEDPEFRAAFDLYPENNPGTNNIYMDIYMYVQNNIDLIAVRDAFSAFEKEQRVELNELCGCRDTVVKYYKNKSERKWRSILQEYFCNDLGGIMKLTKDITDNPALGEAFIFSIAYEYCKADNKTFFNIIDNPYGSGKIPYRYVNDYTCEVCSGKGYLSNAKCRDCDGTGKKKKTCGICDGDGYIQLGFGPKNDCWHCGGTGKVKSRENCHTCGGTGIVDTKCPRCNGNGFTADMPIYACIDYIRKHLKDKIEDNKLKREEQKQRAEQAAASREKQFVKERKAAARAARRPLIATIILDIIFCGIMIAGIISVIADPLAAQEAGVIVGGVATFFGFISTIAGCFAQRKQGNKAASVAWLIGGLVFIALSINLIVVSLS